MSANATGVISLLELLRVQKGEVSDSRRELVHGQYDVKKYLAGEFVTHEDCDNWASPIRRAILAVLVLYLRGQNKREDLLKELSLAALDSQTSEKLRSQSHLDTYFAESRI